MLQQSHSMLRREIQELNASILDLQGKLQSKEWDYDRLQERMQSKENECEQLRNEICLHKRQYSACYLKTLFFRRYV